MVNKYNESEPNTEEPPLAMANEHSESEPELAIIVVPAILQINMFNEIPVDVNEPLRNILAPLYRSQQYRDEPAMNERPQPYEDSLSYNEQSYQSRYLPTKPSRSYRKVPTMNEHQTPYSSGMYNERSHPYASMYN